MFSLKASTFLKSKILMGYMDYYYGYVKQEKQCLWMLRKYNSSDNINTCKNYLYAVLYCKKKRYTKYCTDLQSNVLFSHLISPNRNFCTKSLPNKADTFGDFSYEEYERVEMDEDEKREERFAQDKIKPPKWERLSFGEYSKLIKSYIGNKDVKLALSVLDLMKENGEKPNLYIYRLLLSAFARQGDIKQCFKLFKKLKDSGLVPSPHVYTSLIQACALSNDTETALKYLDYLRRYFIEKRINLNVVQYSTLVKAYGLHNKVLTAFEVADEARDNGIFSDRMVTFLFHATISDKKCGLKYALALWHKMKKNKMKVQIFHYNLLLRAIRDTMFGDLKINDVLIPGSPDTRIELKDVERPDLLDSPPILSTSLVTLLEESNDTFSSTISSEIAEANSVELLSKNLDNILQKNRLFLFGGVEKFLNRMKSDGVSPNNKTVTLLLELLPSTMEAENYFLKYLEQSKLDIDITFFNTLIKKRSMRKRYEDAKYVLNEIQRYHFTPNIVTFGALAIGCTRYKDGVELLEQMNNIGYIPNYKILETLLYNACYHKTFSYVLYLMQYILKNQIKPSKQMLNTLENFDEIVLQLIQDKEKHRYRQISMTKTNYHIFKIKYENWKEKLQTHIHY